MERMKIVLLSFVAIALVKLAFVGPGTGAAAQAAVPGSVTCEMFSTPSAVGAEKVKVKIGEWVEGIRAWLVAHPGEVVFDHTVGIYQVICVRDAP